MDTSIPLYFLILLTISHAHTCKNSSILTNNKSPGLVTDALIHKICSKTGNPALCMHHLGQFKGKPVIPTTLTNIIGLAKHHAQTTKHKISDIHKETQENKPELRLMYQKCIKNYADAMGQLDRAIYGSRDYRKMGPIKQHALIAISDVRSCTMELAKHKSETLGLISDNRMFQDIGSVIVGICNETS
ncbi:plant invertase/pectin methylesterase inhibitor [Striga asiatica]|uniref:Plant invertase/pectin methylesterase inhibitor n=1 Tax=Striga asiatica TaxID=4170 RepID=A0A5A7PRX8_STRAF|nr:plant invertase/pectin methylesterase inhibitor [Striga asiatica]